MDTGHQQPTDQVGVMQRLWRRIQLMSSWGRVSFCDDSKTAQLLQVKLNDSETRDGTPRLAEFGFTSGPPNGSDVLVVFMGGDRSKGVVVATSHQSSRPTGLQQGESMVYDLWGKSIYFTHSGGIVIEAQGSPVTVNNATTVTVNATVEVVLNTPLLSVSGNIVAGGDITDQVRSMAADRTLFNAHTNGSGTTTPTPQQ
ncbi:baseplate assembly protein [Pseudomonas frederiksbergensis]|uniref:Baseplate assembly protein n=2 Tax=Pseudomonas frederiksbergensis TaxID=104087 RepID=A0A423KIE2_9PSED|nr:baseplate assembly protein [Pseudomonas frederiksbergensis]